MKILFVEDDRDVAAFVARNLREAGHLVDLAETGDAGLEMAQSNNAQGKSGSGKYDAIILDRLLPGGLDGLRMLIELRESGDKTPVLFLSALTEVDERVKGLQAGGDDYLPKPFALPELVARLEAMVRRIAEGSAKTRRAYADLHMDLMTREVSRAGQRIDLRPTEFRLLEYLMRHAGQVVTRTMLLEGVWDYHFDPQTNIIDVHISHLRQKVDDPFDVKLIHTIRSSGYVLRAD